MHEPLTTSRHITRYLEATATLSEMLRKIPAWIAYIAQECPELIAQAQKPGVIVEVPGLQAALDGIRRTTRPGYVATQLRKNDRLLAVVRDLAYYQQGKPSIERAIIESGQQIVECMTASGWAEGRGSDPLLELEEGIHAVIGTEQLISVIQAARMQARKFQIFCTSSHHAISIDKANEQTATSLALKGAMMDTAPKVFISYSYDSDAHKQWVRDFAATLRAQGVDVTLDQWHAVHGDQLPQFMEQAIRENKYVLIICTPIYKDRSDKRSGGTGYEGDIMTGEISATRNHRKFIPVLRQGDWRSSIPTWLTGKYGVDLSANPYSQENFQDLLMTIHGHRPSPPPIGPNPFVSGHPNAPAPAHAPPAAKPPADEQTIRIENIILDEVTEPRMDGTAGSALYAIPFQLNQEPTLEWAQIFEQTWRHPPESTTAHRPRLARVEGDRIILDGTTLEEFERSHRRTLKSVMKETNRLFQQWDQQRKASENLAKNKSDQLRRDVRDRGARLNDFNDFDD